MGAILMAMLPTLGKFIESFIPDPKAAAEAKLKMLEMAQNGEMKYLDAAMQEAQGQVNINVEEAKSESLFKSGWRPAAGWVCVLALAYQFAVRPLFQIGYAAYTGHAFPVALPGLDDTLWQLLFGMLGLGGLRTFDKLKGTAK